MIKRWIFALAALAGSLLLGTEPMNHAEPTGNPTRPEAAPLEAVEKDTTFAQDLLLLEQPKEMVGEQKVTQEELTKGVLELGGREE